MYSSRIYQILGNKLTYTLQMKVLSDTALAKFLKIRQKWDPTGLFPNYKKFVQAADKMNALIAKSQKARL